MTLYDALWPVYDAQNTGQEVSQSAAKCRKASQSVVKCRKVKMHFLTLHDGNPSSKKPFRDAPAFLQMWKTP